jgi:hypothetical protein
MNFDWEPTWFEITDGSQTAVALFNPVAYGATDEDAIYAVEGTYTFGDSGESLKAQMLFKDGRLFQVFGFTGEGDASAPYEITASRGDSFTVWLKWMELDSSGNITGIVYETGETLVFEGSPFEWEQVYVPVGDYLLGLLVSDLDGNLTQSYLKVNVE